MDRQDENRETSSTEQTSASTTLKEQVGQKTSEVAEQAQEQASGLLHQVREQASSQLSSQKERATEGLQTVAQAINQTGRQLRQQDQGLASQYTDQAAEQIERFANYLQQRDIEDIVYDIEQFARRQPTLFLGAGFALGLLGSRFLKSSGRSQAQQSDYSTRTFERVPYGGQDYRTQDLGGAGYPGSRMMDESRLESDTSGIQTSMPGDLDRDTMANEPIITGQGSNTDPLLDQNRMNRDATE